MNDCSREFVICLDVWCNNDANYKLAEKTVRHYKYRRAKPNFG